MIRSYVIGYLLFLLVFNDSIYSQITFVGLSGDYGTKIKEFGASGYALYTVNQQIDISPNLTYYLTHKENITDGLSLFVVGLFKKVALADYLALYVDKVYAAPNLFDGSSLMLATFAFCWQIYFDFSGYTDMARGIIKAYIKDYKDRGIFNVTQSAIDTSKTDTAIKALSKLGDLLARNIDGYRDEIKRIRMLSQTFEMADYVDLIHLAELISERIDKESIVRAAKAVVEAASECVLVSDRLGYAVKEANGLSVWFPAYETLYYNYRPKYLCLKD